MKRDIGFNYKHISTVVEDTKSKMDKFRSGTIKPLFTSSKKEKQYIGGLIPSDQVVIAARTGVGKSAKIIQDITDYSNIDLNPYYNDKIIILVDSWEMPAFKNILRMTSRATDTEVKALLDYEQKLTEERYKLIKAVMDTFKGFPIYINTRPVTITDWEESKKQIQGKNPECFIMNIFDHTRLVLKSNEKSEEELITQLMLAGLRLKNGFDMFNIFLSQMNRAIETNISRDKMGEYTPVSSDIFGADSVFQCADIVIALHRPGIYKVEIFNEIPTGYDPSNPHKSDDLLIECVLKNRDGWTGNISMKHDLAHNKIWDYSDNFPATIKFSNQSIL